MFEKVSMTGTGGAIVILLQVIFPLLGIEIDGSVIEQSVAAIMTLTGSVLLIVGQVRRKDMLGGIIRK